MESFRAAWHSGAPRTRAATDCGTPLPAAGAVSSIQSMVEWVGHHAQDAPHGGQRMVRDLQARVRRGAGQPGTLLPVPGLLAMGVGPWPRGLGLAPQLRSREYFLLLGSGMTVQDIVRMSSGVYALFRTVSGGGVQASAEKNARALLYLWRCRADE